MKNQEVHGKVTKAKGQVKEAVGILAGDKKLEREGALQRLEGSIEEGIGKARNTVGEVITDVGHAIKK